MGSEHRKPKKLLTAEQKYDLWVRMLTGQVTQAQAGSGGWCGPVGDRPAACCRPRRGGSGFGFVQAWPAASVPCRLGRLIDGRRRWSGVVSR